ncbi:MAG: helix-turn-helix domain-containing protein [Halioglobus sp.]|nr:helix-turn-helix domain-containing protein [Halioglobus sp.]
MTKLVYPSLQGAEQNFAMLDLIPDTHAWIKDVHGCFVYGNRLFYQRFGFASLHGLLGKTDYDLAPAELAERYCNDDVQVLNGAVVNDRLELITAEGQSGDWFLTSKWPVYNLQEQVIGSFGISRHLNNTEGDAVPFRELRAPIEYIYQHYGSSISVASLAGACNISVSALERRFKKHLQKTPHQYINDVRLDNARRLLRETDKPIGTIALETGFADHSHFTRAFIRKFGHAPSADRRARAVDQPL